jgi:hypothetical protein
MNDDRFRSGACPEISIPKIRFESGRPVIDAEDAEKRLEQRKSRMRRIALRQSIATEQRQIVPFQEFYHPHIPQGGVFDDDDCYSFGAEAWVEPTRDEVLEYNGRRFIAIETFYQSNAANARGISYTTVPGYVASEIKGHQGSIGKCTLVERIDDSDKEGIIAILMASKFAPDILVWGEKEYLRKVE